MNKLIDLILFLILDIVLIIDLFFNDAAAGLFLYFIALFIGLAICLTLTVENIIKLCYTVKRKKKKGQVKIKCRFISDNEIFYKIFTNDTLKKCVYDILQFAHEQQYSITEMTYL